MPIDARRGSIRRGRGGGSERKEVPTAGAHAAVPFVH